jgi:hypothetical protein
VGKKDKSPLDKRAQALAKNVMDFVFEDFEDGSQDLRKGPAPELPFGEDEEAGIGADEGKPQNLKTGLSAEEDDEYTELMAKLKKPDAFDIPNPEGHEENVFKDWLKEPLTTDFGDWYRDRWSGQDELVCTAAMRAFCTVFRQEINKRFNIKAKRGKYKDNPELRKKLNVVIDELNRIIDNVSRVRLPTKETGYALSETDWMQHPTGYITGSSGPYDGLFHQRQGKHKKLNDAREEQALRAMEEEWDNNPAKSVESMFIEGSNSAALFTMNRFAAPVLSDSVYPYTELYKRTKLDPNDARWLSEADAKKIGIEQVKRREKTKKISQKQGAPKSERTALSGEERLKAPWPSGEDDELSQSRITVSSSEDGESSSDEEAGRQASLRNNPLKRSLEEEASDVSLKGTFKRIKKTDDLFSNSHLSEEASSEGAESELSMEELLVG